MSDESFARIRIHTDTLESNISRILGRMKDVVLSDELKVEAIKKYRKKVEPYVPEKKGFLKLSAYDSDAIVDYHGDKALVYDPVANNRQHYHYGKVQYEGPGPGEEWNRTTEGTYDHWNQHLTRAEREEYYQELADMYVKEIKNNGR